jgi:hypothetical protein
MSSYTPPTQLLLQPGHFRERLIVYLLPYFLRLTKDFDLARAEVLETLASYGARTRSEMINATRIIAFGFSSLELLAEAKSAELPVALSLRYRSCANALNRSCQQIEKALAKSLACDALDPVKPTPESVDDMPDAEVEAALQRAKARIDSYHNRLSGPHPATSPQTVFSPAKFAAQQNAAKRQTGSAIFNALVQAGTPPKPASPT